MSASTYISTHKSRFVAELSDWLRISSVSADAAFTKDVILAADYLEKRLKEAGAKSIQRFETDGHPIVYAQSKSPHPNAPTVLVYGHYDVQPADPYELWDTPPFEPNIRNGRIYARGACDDKGQAYMHIKALETMQALSDQPCHIKFLFEAEEEIGSPNLGPFLAQQQALLACDAVLISDTAMVSKKCPSITIGLRGLCYMEVLLEGTNRDLHSGEYGGIVDNPILALSGMLAALKDPQGRITIPGFYDNVRPLSAKEAQTMAEIPFDKEAFRTKLGAASLFGEANYGHWARIGARPTLDANGIWGGYAGEGAKTVLPARAGAKLSMRLVPDQSPAAIEQLSRRYLEQLLPPSMKMTLKMHHSSPASLLSVESEAYAAAEKAVGKIWKKTPLPIRSGGSVPIVPLFEDILGHAPVMMGFGLEEDSLHAPNESFDLTHFSLGIETIVQFYRDFYDTHKNV